MIQLVKARTSNCMNEREREREREREKTRF